MNAQMKRGALDLCVLALLSRSDVYGYEAAATIAKVMEMSEGTLYPLLKRLRDDELVTTYLKESNEGPPRKYYSITEPGKTKKEMLLRQWNEFVDAVNRIVSE